jgi:hypothetical protein
MINGPVESHHPGCTPKAFNNLAQGCALRATLGTGIRFNTLFTLKGFAHLHSIQPFQGKNVCAPDPACYAGLSY